MIITRDLLRAIRNDLPMKLTIVRLREHGPITKQVDGYFRFQCPSCGELRATVNPKPCQENPGVWGWPQVRLNQLNRKGISKCFEIDYCLKLRPSLTPATAIHSPHEAGSSCSILLMVTSG